MARRAVAWGLVAVALLGTATGAGAGASDAHLRMSVPPGSRPRLAAERRAEVNGFLPSEVECRIRAALRVLTAGLKLDCDDLQPNNEPDIEVDPADPLHAVASSNDYGSSATQFYTTFDGGLTWRTGNMSTPGKNRLGGDPVTTFDPRHGTVLHAALSFAVRGKGEEEVRGDGDIVVSVSRDGGVVWGRPVVVADGVGFMDDPVSVFNDKEWMVTDAHPNSPFYGRTYLTWTRFIRHDAKYREAAIWAATSDDGGRTWSEPKEISGGDSELCTFQVDGPRGRCDEDQYSIPTVAPDGTVFVAFQNFQHEAAWEAPEDVDSQYLVVRSSDGGRRFSDPVHVVDLEDGHLLDYPVNADGRQTLTGIQVRVNSAGNLAADPRTGELFLVFSDNRAGQRGPKPVTDTNVYLMRSPDGRRWSGPHPVATGGGDQWFPWVEVDPVTGELGVLFNDADPARRGLYGVSLARGHPGSFHTTSVAAARSDLRQSRHFKADVPGCRRCATFHGDYIGLDYGPDGRVWAAWTDMREEVTLKGKTGRQQNIFVTRR
jgi:hypothetical protein